MLAQGIVSRVAIVTETVWGTTPSTPELTAVPFVSFNLNLTKSIYEDASVQADRMERSSIHGNRQVGGDIVCNYSATNFDPFLESLMNNAWAADVLKTGTTRKSFTFEQGSTDINQYSVFTGVVIDKMDLNVPVDGICTSNFTLLGKAMTVSGTPLDATVTLAATKVPFVHQGGTFKVDGVTSGVLTGIKLIVDNGYTANFALGNAFAAELSYGFAKVTGTITAYFQDATLLNSFINGTESSLEFTLTDGTHTHNYLIPRIKLNGSSKPVSGTGSIVLTIPFVGLYDDTTGTNLRITRA